MNRATTVKFAGLVAFIAISALAVVFAWPLIADVFSEGGVERLVDSAQHAGAAGVLMMLGVQLLQVIVAFIPGEVVQLAAGVMYGPWWGTLLLLFGCVIGSSIVYALVHRLGAPFVREMVSTKHLDAFRRFEASGKLDLVVFILFLIPAMPKDVFTYLVPLTSMEYKRFITLTTIGRIPGIVGSTYAASGYASGDIVGPTIVMVILVVLAIIAIVFRDRILNALGKGHA